jgi:hypothetical protein
MTQTLTTRLSELGISPTPIHPSEHLYRSPVTTPRPIPASFSVASSTLNLFNFSHSPASTQTDSRTQAIGTLLFENSNAFARAEGTAGFRGGPIVPLPETVASLTAFNLTSGDGKGYDSDAFTRNFVKGLDFYIKPKETFKFDLKGLLALDTQSTSSREKAIAQGKISIIVYATNACGITTAIDRLLINGQQNGSHTALNLNVSNGFKLNTQTTPLSLSANELSFNGTYSRTFKTATTLTFVATQDTSTTARRNHKEIAKVATLFN